MSMQCLSSSFGSLYRGQRGAALITGLIFLVILTLIVLAGLGVSNLEERMAGNARDRDLAFQAAEAALQQAEQVLQQPALPNFALGTGYTPQINGAGTDSFWQTYNWSGQSITYNPGLNGGQSISGVAAQPQYVVEQMPAVTGPGSSLVVGPLGSTTYYRITARGVGATTDAVVILQATFRR